MPTKQFSRLCDVGFRSGCLFVLCAFPLAPASSLGAVTEMPLAREVNPLIGTDQNPLTRFGFAWDTGNVFPGAVCPQGMIAWSPDTTHADKIAGGYWYVDNEIQGFSLTHFSGRGVPCLRDIPFLPTVAPVQVSPGKDWMRYAGKFSHQNEAAAPGYYRVQFDNGIETAVTATLRSGLAEFRFPADAPATLLVRADTSLVVKGNEVSGYHRNTISGKKRSYTLYFAAVFEQPFKRVDTWAGDIISNTPEAAGDQCGAILQFDTAKNLTVKVRVGISYVSVENARANLAAENPGWDLTAVRQKAATAWNATLNTVQVAGGSESARQVFYTAFYHSFIHPNILDDANGQYPGMDEKIHTVESGRHQYQNIPAWDQYRSQATLMAILKPKVSSDVMQSLVNYAQQDLSVRPKNGGGFPRWEQVNHNSGGMVGDGDPIMIASAYAFGADQFDTRGALEAMHRGASQPGTTSDGFEVRDGLQDYISLGHVPGAVSITLEYCNSDFAISQFAKAMGDEEKHAVYLKRAQNWKNLFHESTHLLQPRNAAGSWNHELKPGSVSDMRQPFVEASAEQTVWMVNFNLKGLVEKLGGPAATIARLDYFLSSLNSGMRSDKAYMGNEPGEGIPWIYCYTGAPAKTQEVVRRIQRELFTPLPSGLPGNDDAGALSSWYVFSALGLFPEIPSVGGLVVGSPVFPRVTIHRGNGAKIEIVGEQAAPENCYVQSLAVNDNPRTSPWILWSNLAAGGTLHFKLGSQPSSWGADLNQAPPSFDTVTP